MLIIDGKRLVLPGQSVVSYDYLANSAVALRSKSFSPRKEQIKGIVLHTRMGMVSRRVNPTPKDNNWDRVVAARWAQQGRSAGSHIAVDSDGTYSCMCDIVKHAAHHAGQVNQYTVGIEIYQSSNGDLYLPSLITCADIVEFLCDKLDIPRRFPNSDKIEKPFAIGGHKKPWRKSNALAWIDGGEAGALWRGVYGHRNATRNRGAGDPGDEIFGILESRGFERVAP